jgi:hypothetical protein
VEEDGISEAMKAVMRAQGQWSGKGLKDLGPIQPAAVRTNGSNGHKADAEEREPTDQEMEAIKEVMARNASQYRD